MPQRKLTAKVYWRLIAAVTRRRKRGEKPLTHLRMLAKGCPSISLLAWTIAGQARALCPGTGISVFSGVGQPTASQVELPVYASIFQTPYGWRMLRRRFIFCLKSTYQKVQ